MPKTLNLSELAKSLGQIEIPYKSFGKVIGIQSGLIEAEIPYASLGNLCSVKSGNKSISCKVVSFNKSKTLLAPFTDTLGIGPMDTVISDSSIPSISFPENPIGMVLDAFGSPLDNNFTKTKTIKRALVSNPPDVLSRKVIDETFITGITAIDSLCTLGKGQRIGLMASAGVGKSTLLGMIAKNAEVDVTVIALVGERGREVNEFIQDILGPSGLEKSVLVVTTSDESAVRRSIAASTATSIAEMYRSQGKNVLLLVDSITRTARAIRDLSLVAGELPVRQGYTPSVYNELPKLFERAGNDNSGSITAIYTVLTSSEEESDPLSEEIKSLLDGHISLSKEIVHWGIRPAIDIPNSISRVMTRVAKNKHLAEANNTRQAISRLIKDKEILAFGGTPDSELKAAIELEPEIKRFLNQTPLELRQFKRSLSILSDINRKFSESMEAFRDTC